MGFIQIMEYEMDFARALDESERYMREAKGQTYVRSMTLCSDKKGLEWLWQLFTLIPMRML